jgi:hypothetical protein
MDTKLHDTRRLAVCGLAGLGLLLGPGFARADAARPLRMTVAPRQVVPGARLTVRVSDARSRCRLTLGTTAVVDRIVRGGTRVVRIPASTHTGVHVARVRCGGRSASVRFRVLGIPARPIADEQGFVAGSSGSQEDIPSGLQLGGGDYLNSRIADIGLSKVGQNLFTPGLDHGQCKQAVNDWVAIASGGTQRMGTDYYTNYARNGGTQIGRDQAIKGDIIQLDNPSDISNYYKGMHTAVVVAHAAGSDTFDVVDSNFALDDTVQHHSWDPYAAGRKYRLRVTIWRMGSPDAAVSPQPPTPQPNPTPTPPPAARTWSETVGGNAHTWTNYTNAGGTQGPTIPAYATVQIACKLQGFKVQDGNTWWYRIASSPWNNAYYVSADAFYNNGQTSGSLTGTPFVDPTVQDC